MKYNRKTIKRVSLAAGDLIPLADVKSFLRIDDSSEDFNLVMFTNAAIDAAEKYTRRALREQTLDHTMDGFPSYDDSALERLGAGIHTVSLPYLTGSGSSYDLPLAPIKSISSITTYDRANIASVFPSEGYILDGFRVTLNEGYVWPTNLRERAAVETRYVAGYGVNDLPAAIKVAILQHIAAMYECRKGCDMPAASMGALNAYRLWDGLTW